MDLVWYGMLYGKVWACFGGRRKPGGVDDVEMPTNRPPSYPKEEQYQQLALISISLLIMIMITVYIDTSTVNANYTILYYTTIPARLQ